MEVTWKGIYYQGVHSANAAMYININLIYTLQLSFKL